MPLQNNLLSQDFTFVLASEQGKCFPCVISDGLFSKLSLASATSLELLYWRKSFSFLFLGFSGVYLEESRIFPSLRASAAAAVLQEN